MSDLTDLSLAELQAALGTRKCSAVEATTAYLDRIEAAGALGAYITVTPDIALAGAEESDRRLGRGEARPLEGVPLGIKDLFCTKGVPTTAASKILGGFTPTYESTVTRKLFEDGATMLGKLSLDEFAMGSSNENAASGPVVNPWRRENDDTRLIPGGSSGGSSAAVAARLCAGATGTDTGGSIRQPAAMTGTVGIKPTYGRCSRFGIVAYASSLDQAGPMTRTVKDSAILLGSMSGHDPKDSTSLDQEVPDYVAALDRGVKGLKIGVPKEYHTEEMPPEIDTLWQRGKDWLREAGAEVREVSLPLTKYALAAYYIIAPAEASSNLARYDGVRYGLRVADDNINEMYSRTRDAGFGDEVKRRIMIGTYVLSAGYYDAYYLKAQKVRKMIFEEMKSVMADVDLLLTPTTPTAAFPIGEKRDDPVSMYLGDIFTVPVNLAGVPAISLPAGYDLQGLPLGLQLIGRPCGEETVFAGARALEKAANFTGRPADWWAN